jgi:hypothetical protein
MTAWYKRTFMVKLLNTIFTNKTKRMITGIPSVEFNSHDDLILDLVGCVKCVSLGHGMPFKLFIVYDRHKIGCVRIGLSG